MAMHICKIERCGQYDKSVLNFPSFLSGEITQYWIVLDDFLLDVHENSEVALFSLSQNSDFRQHSLASKLIAML